jgi:catechol 2,3-dioxygenase-like lactoylglutathione lyase family enzyme
MVFVLETDLELPPSRPSLATNSGPFPPAASQHFALRTQNVEGMLRFYTEDLGFALSDEVKDDFGQLKACFVRGNEMHHTLALFGAPVSCFDHQSFETPGWHELKHWADHMGQLRVEIVWGVGRHGPGNDVFFMVRDPDGNLAEISSEIEICAVNRPAGQWKHEERTLNLWGKAIMRS